MIILCRLLPHRATNKQTNKDLKTDLYETITFSARCAQLVALNKWLPRWECASLADALGKFNAIIWTLVAQLGTYSLLISWMTGSLLLHSALPSWIGRNTLLLCKPRILTNFWLIWQFNFNSWLQSVIVDNKRLQSYAALARSKLHKHSGVYSCLFLSKHA